jgi:hypothetical protein
LACQTDFWLYRPNMSLHKSRRVTALLAGLIGLATIVVWAPSANAGVQPVAKSGVAATTASVTLVHGVRGLLADVVVDGQTALKGFAYERASAPMQLPAGVHRVQVFKAGVAHTTALLDVKLTVKAGQTLTAAVGFDSAGGPKAYVFDDRLSAAARSASSVVVRNVSQGAAPQVLLDGTSISSGLAAGGQVIRGVSPGSHKVGLKVNGAWLLTNQPVRAASGRAMVVYIVGLQSAKSIALVADSVTPTTAAARVNSGGLPPMTEQSLMPRWLSLGSLSVGVLSLLVFARRRKPAMVDRLERGAYPAS